MRAPGSATLGLDDVHHRSHGGGSARIRMPVAPAGSVAVPEAETAVAKAAAVPAAEATEAMGRSRSRGECSAAEGNGRDEREADLSQHDTVLLWMRMGVIAHPAPFVRRLIPGVHAGALLQIASIRGARVPSGLFTSPVQRRSDGDRPVLWLKQRRALLPAHGVEIAEP
jgi:hypothetical protein